MGRGPLHWFVHNPIAANLLMILLIIGGVSSIPGLEKQFFPAVEISEVAISMSFPGASPREVEEQIAVRIEEAIHDLNGIEEIRSTAREGSAQVRVEAIPDYPMQRLTNDIKTRIDAINTFPVDAERPVVTEITFRHLMGVVHLSGDLDERELKELGETLRDDLARQPNISIVELSTPRPYEVSIEVSELDLRRYGLTFEQVVNAIRSASLNLPAGAIKGDDGDIRVQTRGQAYERSDFDAIVLSTSPDGAQIRLGDVATVIDGFEDIDIDINFNGQPALGLYAFVTSKPDVLLASKTIRNWVEDKSVDLPPNVSLTFWRDTAKPFRLRVKTLLENGIGGLILVSLVLVLFLRPKLALWVASGIMVAFLGTFFLLPLTGMSLNMISLFAFLLVLGIVVDDAIIVGEAVHSAQTRGEMGEAGALSGVRSVFKPVLFAVISTMVFFAPMMFLPGDWSIAARAIPVVVLLALFFSLVECLLILPSHLAHMGPEKPARWALWRRVEAVRHACAEWLVNVARYRFRPFLAFSLRHHLLVGGLFLTAFSVSVAMYGGGWLKTAFFPRINSDFVFVEIDMPEGGAYADSVAVRDRVVLAAEALKAEWNSRPEYLFEPAIGNIIAVANENSVEVTVQSISEQVDTELFAKELRAASGELREAKEVRMDFTIRDPGKPIYMVLASRNVDHLEALADEVRAALETYPGVFDISDSFDSPRDEVVLALKPAAENLGITLAEVARQVRQAFYGDEVQRIPRAREDVRVMVRYPESERRSLANLRDMYIRTPAGTEVPFETVADYRIESGYQKLERLNRLRTLEIRADVSAEGAQPREIVEGVFRDYLPVWQAKYPGLTVDLEGELRDQAEFQSAMVKFMALAMLIIYGLMAVAFRSYWQPLLVLTAVPFGLMGAIFGHALLNWQVSIFSMMGVIACAGVVVNDNLVLIDRINQLREQGYELMEALLQGAEDRFRPIILTSLTTFVGLLPIMSETSVQAQFLIPMVISLAFGVLLATGVTLLLVPALYLFAEDLAVLAGRLRGGQPKPASLTPESSAEAVS